MKNQRDPGGLRKALFYSALIAAFLAAWMLATHVYMRHRWGQTLTVGPQPTRAAPQP